MRRSRLLQKGENFKLTVKEKIFGIHMLIYEIDNVKL